MGTFNLFTRIAKVNAQKTYERIIQKEQNHIDKRLPLGMRFGATVKIENINFVLAEDRLFISSPTEGYTMKAVGVGQVAGVKYYNFYLASDVDEAEAIISVVAERKDGKDISREIMFGVPFDEREPFVDENIKEWYIQEQGITVEEAEQQAFVAWINSWIGELDDEDDNPGGTICQSSFFVPSDRKAEDENLSYIEFVREWGDPTSGYIDPIEYTEKIYMDSFGENVIKVQHKAMRFIRQTGSEDVAQEYLLASFEEDDSGDIRVRLTMFVPVSASEIQVL